MCSIDTLPIKLDQYYPDGAYRDPRAMFIDDQGFRYSSDQALKNLRVRLIPDGSGNWIPTEFTVCNRPVFNPDHFIRLYDHAIHPAPPVRGDENDPAVIDRSRRRALRMIRDIMDCNTFDWFLTFTLNGTRYSRDDYATFCRTVNKYLANRVQRYGWSYVACMEYHHDHKNLHLHAVVKADQIKLVDSGTVLRPTGGKPVKLATALKQGFSREELKTVYNVTDWVDGWSTAIHTYGSPASLARYITKYITKSENKVGGRWYYSGGDLIRPQYVYDNVDYNLIDGKEYINAGGSFKVVYLNRSDSERMPFESLQSTDDR